MTSSAGRIQSPYGFSPTYLGLMQSDFDRAGEEAWLVGLSYDFARVGLEGLSGFVNFAMGYDARDPRSAERFASQYEVDLTVDYRFAGWRGLLEGLWLRVRASSRGLEGAPTASHQIRVIVNYDLPIL